MGLCETGRALHLIILLALLQNLLAEPSDSPNETVTLVTVVAAPVVQLVGTEGNLTHPMEVEFGPCTVTCGIGMREVILTSGCPGNEKKCIVRIEECKGPPDCGWGKPVSESIESVKMPCIFITPENRFQYVWKMLIPGQQSLIIPNDSAVLEVHRDTHPTAFECDTMEDEELVANVKYTVYTMDELETRRTHKSGTNIALVFVLITGIIVCICVIFGIVFIIFNWTTVKIFWQTKVWKSRDDSSSAFRSSSGLTPMGDPSQTSQAGSFHKQVSYQEWNEPPEGGEGGGGGGGGEGGAKGGETDGEKGNY